MSSGQSGSEHRRRLRVIGAGRAGGALQTALGRVGWEVQRPMGPGDDLGDAAQGVDLLVIATPDAVIAEAARAVRPADATVVGHLAGSLGLEVLAPHRRRVALHPLVSLPSAEVGAERLAEGAWFAQTGDPLGLEVVDALGGRVVEVGDDDRAAYHAAACIASNHLVALLGQVERIAASVGVPFAAYVDVVRSTVDNVERMGPAAALTGPAARGDLVTLERHRAALPADELAGYDAMVALARRLAGAEVPERTAVDPRGAER